MTTERSGFARRLALALAADDRREQEVAVAAGVSPSQLSRWKTGEATPLVTSVDAVVAALGISGHWLLTGDGPMRPPSGDEQTRLRVIGRIAGGDLDPTALEWLLSGAPVSGRQDSARRAQLARDLASPDPGQTG